MTDSERIAVLEQIVGSLLDEVVALKEEKENSWVIANHSGQDQTLQEVFQKQQQQSRPGVLSTSVWANSVMQQTTATTNTTNSPFGLSGIFRKFTG